MKLSSPVVSAIVVATALQLSGYAAPAARAQNADPRPAPYYDLHKSYIYEPWQNHFHGTGVGYWPHSIRFGRQDLRFSYRAGRATERYRQNVMELREKLRLRLQHSHEGSSQRSGTDRTGDPRPATLHYPYVSPLGELHHQGRELESYRQEELYLREQLTLLSYSDLFERGLKQFRAGRFGQAARSFVAAADANHEDAASRIHAAQALMAVGLYKDAMVHVRRAFELAPALMNMPLDLAADYTDQNDYRAHLGALEQHLADHPADSDAAILLAVVRFFSPDPTGAGDALARIKPLARRDPFVHNLLRAAAPVIPQAR